MIPKNLEEICELFDCRILEDFDYETDEIVFYLGDDGDLSVGIFPFVLTPTFPSKEMLKSFCESEEGVEHINEAAAEAFCDWDEYLMEWTDEEDW